jgi:hypothetical protein
MTGEAGDRDRSEHDPAHEVGSDHRPAAPAAVGPGAAVEREQERREPIREPNGDHAERAAGHDGDPHHGDELKRIAEAAHRVGEVGAPEVGSFAEHGFAVRP